MAESAPCQGCGAPWRPPPATSSRVSLLIIVSSGPKYPCLCYPAFMVQVAEISLAEFKRMAKKPPPLGERGRESVEILGVLKTGRPMVIRGASRGFQAVLSRRIKKKRMSIEMRIEREAGGLRTIALLKRR